MFGHEKTRRKFSSAFKTKIVLKPIKECNTLVELAKQIDLHPKQISIWKKEFLPELGKVGL
ncbi:MAG TPA: hypothetical protein DCM62_05880 [Bacteroidales bacterium]|nr:hypothetical protein [Bacteroidales bacterium]